MAARSQNNIEFEFYRKWDLKIARVLGYSTPEYNDHWGDYVADNPEGFRIVVPHFESDITGAQALVKYAADREIKFNLEFNNNKYKAKFNSKSFDNEGEFTGQGTTISAAITSAFVEFLKAV